MHPVRYLVYAVHALVVNTCEQCAAYTVVP
jgi:hypothetical protein